MEGDATASGLRATPGDMGLVARATCATALLVLEKGLLNLCVDFDAAQAATGLGMYVRITQHFGLRFLVAFAAAIALFGATRRSPALVAADAAARSLPWRIPWLLLHAALFALLALISFSFYDGRGLRLPLPALILLWLAAAAAALAALMVALAPVRLWRGAVAALGTAWIFAAATAAAAVLAIQWSQMLWEPVTQLTFDLVADVLRPLIPLHTDPAAQVLDTGRFAVQVSYLCSGLEGAGLMLAFSALWLLYFRREYRFPRALLILPAGLLLVFVLNVLRIAALVLIGHAGLAGVAVYGFHSQAGWIGFNCAAVSVAYCSHRSPWLNRSAGTTAPRGCNPTAAYLLPFLAVLAAGMLSRAASAGFETWYALRIFAAAAVIGVYWKQLRGLDFGFSWRGPLAGVAVFALWIAAAHLLVPRAAMPPQLTALPPLGRGLWVCARAVTAVIAVPLVEELAYRGYLMRRIRTADFESVRFAAAGSWGLLVSSVAFGLAHGPLWLPGSLAGLVYGTLAMRSGRIGEAVAGHAVTNGLIAASVLAGGHWELW